MELFNIFKTDQDGIRRSHIKNLISIAMVDGHLDPEEWELLCSIARVLGMSTEEIEHIKNNPDAVQFVPPRKYEEKVEQIHDLVAIMTIDGQINAKELDLCKKISLKLDILPQMVDQILEDVFPADQKS
jgi:tellurite resistance protein